MKKLLLLILFSSFTYAQENGSYNNMNVNEYLNEDVKPITKQLDFCLNLGDYAYYVKKYTLTNDNAVPLYEIFLNELKIHDIKESTKNILLSRIQSSEYFSKQIKDKDSESIERLSTNSRFVELEGCLGANFTSNTDNDLNFLTTLNKELKTLLKIK